MFFKVHPYSSFTPSNKHNLVTGRLSLSIALFTRTSTVLINPSALANKFSTRPKDHWFLATLSSATRTMSQTWRFPFSCCHLGLSCKVGTYSLSQCLQWWLASNCACCHLFCLGDQLLPVRAYRHNPCQYIPSSPHGISARDPGL